MKVRELVELLSGENQELEVYIEGPPHEGWVVPIDIEVVELDVRRPAVTIVLIETNPAKW